MRELPDREQPSSGLKAGRVEAGCSVKDESPGLRYRATLRDELMGNPLTVAARTELLCRAAVTELGKQVVAGVNQPRFAVTTACAPA